MSLVHPHPALKVAVPMNPMVDGWIGDDWFHHGAFRQLGTLNYVYEQEATRANDEKWWTDHYDDYDAFLEPARPLPWPPATARTSSASGAN